MLPNVRMKQFCRLCYYETTDTIEIFSEKGLERDYTGKISKYLYLKVLKDDNQPQTVCWMCSQHLETFHQFYEKINEIQRSMLKENYESAVIRVEYKSADNDKEGADESFDDTFEVIVLNSSEDNTYEQIEVEDDETQVEEQEAEQEQEAEHELDQELEQEPDQELEEEQPNLNDDMNKIIEIHESLKRELDEANTGCQTKSIVNKKTKCLIETLSEKPAEEIDISNTSAETMKCGQNKQKTDSAEKRTSEKTTENTSIKIEQIDQDDQDQDNNSNKSASPLKRKRGRPRKSSIKSDNQKEESLNKEHQQQREQSPILGKRIKKEIQMDIDLEEGESDNEFPARDSDNEDWPSQATLEEFPKKILTDGYLLVKGKRLMNMISKFYKLVCDLCPEKPRYKQLKCLFNHYSEQHHQDGYLLCCQTKLSRYPAIIMHMARHLQPDAFKCDECGYMVTRPRFLQSHKQTHLPKDLKPFKCDVCDRRFCWKGALQIHMISHTKPEDRKLYVCHVCGKIYDTPGGLSTHKKQAHTEKIPSSNVCHVCAKKFATRTGLNEHMATIHQPREKDQVQCTECGKWLMNQRCLKSHMVLHSDTLHECTLCPYQTKKLVLLKRHLLTQHSDEKPYKCDICQKSFKLRRALTVHIAQHNSTSKSYKCTFCDRQFNSSTNFYTHRKNMHPMELQQLKNEILEKQRQKRIKAGIETDNGQRESETCGNDDPPDFEDDVDSSATIVQTKNIAKKKPPKSMMKLQEHSQIVIKVDDDNKISFLSEENEKIDDTDKIEILVTENCEIVSIGNERNSESIDTTERVLTLIPIKSINSGEYLGTTNVYQAVTTSDGTYVFNADINEKLHRK